MSYFNRKVLQNLFPSITFLVIFIVLQLQCLQENTQIFSLPHEIGETLYWFIVAVNFLKFFLIRKPFIMSRSYIGSLYMHHTKFEPYQKELLTFNLIFLFPLLQGYFQTLLSVIERFLSDLQVEVLITSVDEHTQSMWINKFGFVEVTHEEVEIQQILLFVLDCRTWFSLVFYFGISIWLLLIRLSV